jgi:hypothetical protein
MARAIAGDREHGRAAHDHLWTADSGKSPIASFAGRPEGLYPSGSFCSLEA